MSNGSNASTGSPASTTETPVTSWWYNAETPHDKTVHHTYGVLTLLLCIATLLGDVFLLFYFLTKKRRPSTLIYYCLLVCDAVLAMTGIFVALDLLVYETEEFKIVNRITKEENFFIADALAESRTSIARQVNSYFYGVASRMSCMINCYLSVVRAIVIVSPFTNIRPWALLGSLAAYTGLVVIVVLVAFVTNTAGGGYCSHMWMFCDAEFSSSTGGSELLDEIILIGIPYVVPCIPVLISCCLIIYKQVTSDQFGDKMRDGTITIIYVSVLFFICNSAYLIFTFVEYDMNYNAINDDGSKTNGYPDYNDMAKYYGLRTFSTFTNAGGNALILISRSSGVKEFCVKILRREIKLLDIIDPAKARRDTQFARTVSSHVTSAVGYMQRQSAATSAARDSASGTRVGRQRTDSLLTSPEPGKNWLKLKEMSRHGQQKNDEDLRGENLPDDSSEGTSASNKSGNSKKSKKGKVSSNKDQVDEVIINEAGVYQRRHQLPDDGDLLGQNISDDSTEKNGVYKKTEQDYEV